MEIVNKEKFNSDFELYKNRLSQKLDENTVNLMLHAYCMGYCDTVNHVQEHTETLYLINPVLDKITELSKLVNHNFE